MKSFHCELCRKPIEINLEGKFTTGCEHYPVAGLEYQRFAAMYETIVHISRAKSIHSNMLDLHIRALSCHCECLGMNAENSLAVCNNTKPPYSDDSYLSVLRKWRLVDENFKPVI